MKISTKASLVIIMLLLAAVLTSCGTNLDEGEKLTNGENSENVNEEDTVEEEPIEDVELNLGEKAKVDPLMLENMFKDDVDMLLRFNDFLGKKAPNFKFTTLDNEEKEIVDYEGENIILEFMGTWCPACIDTIETNDEFNKSYEGAELIGLGVNDDTETLNKLIEEGVVNTKYVIPDDKAADLYDLIFVPMYVFIDSEGYVQMILPGGAPVDALKDFANQSFK